MAGIENLSGELLWLAVPVILLAGLVHGTFGLGFPMVATPLLALSTDVRSAVLLTLLPTIAVNVSLLGHGAAANETIGRHWRLIPYVLAGTVIGSVLLMALDPRPFLLVLAGAILLYLNQRHLQMLDLGWVHRHSTLAHAFFGLIAGIMAGTVNVMVPVLIIFTLELKMAIPAMIQLFNINFLSGKLTQTVIFLGAGHVSFGALLNTALWLVPVALTGLYAGRRLNRLISEQRYRWILRGLLWVMVIVLTVRFFASAPN